MDIQRFAEQYMDDAMRLAKHFAVRYNAQISEGIGNADDFHFAPKQRALLEEDVRIFRVEGDDFYGEVAFVFTDEPKTSLDRKHRNNSIHKVIVGEQITSFREKRGLSLEEMAAKVGYTPHSLARIEEGRWDIDLKQLGLLLDALGARIELVDSNE